MRWNGAGILRDAIQGVGREFRRVKSGQEFLGSDMMQSSEYSGISGNRLIEMERKLLKEEKALRQLNETHDKLNNEYNAK